MKHFTRILALLLALLIILPQPTMIASAAEILEPAREWILTFSSADSAKEYAELNDGEYLGGSMALVKAQESVLQSVSGVQEMTRNEKLDACSLNDTEIDKQWYFSDSMFGKSGDIDGTFEPFDGYVEGAKAVRIAVIDTGVDATHPDLQNRVVAGYDAVNESEILEGTNSDIASNSHGTKVAGLIAAEANNNEGITGTAYRFPVEIVPVRALDENANGKIADVIKALYWAADYGNVDIINMSFGKTMSAVPKALQTAIDYVTQNNIIPIAAAGNNGKAYKYSDYDFYPAALTGVLAVGSIAKQKNNGHAMFASFSNRFTNENSGHDLQTYVCKKIFFVPGEELYTTSSGGTYDYFEGTSASAALFSGAIAAMLSMNGSERNYDPIRMCTISGSYYYAVYNNYYDMGSNYNAWVTGSLWNLGYPRWQPYDTDAFVLSGSHASVDGVVTLGDSCDYLVLEIGDYYGYSYESVATIELSDQYIQPVHIEFDTTGFDDGRHVYRICAVRGEFKSELYANVLMIDNSGYYYKLHAFENGEALVGANVKIYDSTGALMQSGKLSSKNEFAFSKYLVEDYSGTFAVVQTDSQLIVRNLESDPADGEYSFGYNPTTLTIKADSFIAQHPDCTLNLNLTDTLSIPVQTISQKETVLQFDTDRPLTLDVSSDELGLFATFNLNENDAVWDLDEVLAQTHTVTVTADEDEYMDSLILWVEGTGYHLAATGGSVTLSQDTYDFRITAAKNNYSGFMLSFDDVELTEDKSFTVGTDVSVTLTSKNEPKQYDKLTLEAILTDTVGNPIADYGFLMDNGHYHPTEVVSDKIPALLTFFPEIALHITRPIRWDSDHVVLFDDETKELCKEIVRCGGLDGRVDIALDYFDASINRISAWTVGYRNVQKALLNALLEPQSLKKMQDNDNFTKLLVVQEELKTLPFGDVWNEYCRQCGKPLDNEWFSIVEKYESEELSKR